MNYRVMEAADIDLVTPLYIDYYNSQGDAWTPETVRRRIWQVLGSPDSYCLLATEEDTIVGFAMGRFEQFYDLAAYNLVEIIIAGAHQGRGRGTALMKELERRVKELGAAMVQLMAVNDDAHERFYGRLGYKDASNLTLKARFL